MAPSKVTPAAIVFAAERALVPVLAGKTVCKAVFVARASRWPAGDALEVAKRAASPISTV
jgi:hypothetical protein